MKISEKTQQILRNFSTINPSILLNKGHRITSMSIMRNIIVSSDVEENFPNKIGIYDLPRFLSNLQMYPELEFHDDHIMMFSEDRRYEFRTTDEKVIVHPKKTFKLEGSEFNTDESKEFPEVLFSVNLTEASLSRIKKVSTINSLPDYALMTDGGIIYFVALDKKNSMSDVSREPVGESTDDFKIYFKSDNFKLYDGTYKISVSSISDKGSGLSTFKNENELLQYWVAIESDSYYNKV